MNFFIKLKNLIIKDRTIIFVSVFLGLVFTILFSTKSYADKTQEAIAKNILRFHVKANSDSYEDQMLKLAVKNRILEKFENELRNSDSLEQTEEVMFLKLDEIEKTAKEEITARGYDYDVTASIKDSEFPTKQYGDTVLPPGIYKAVVVDIGNANGKNWWCVMYPPLCYVDNSKTAFSYETDKKLKQSVTKDQYDIMKLEKQKNPGVRIKFKVVEMWENKKVKDYQLVKK